MSAEVVCVKQELEGKHGEPSARVEAPQLTDPVVVKEEPKFEPESEEFSRVKAEPSSELYADHVVKDELVLGPERPHRPTGGYVVQSWALCDADGCPQEPGARGGARRVTLRDCSVRLERLLHHEAMPPHTEHPETSQEDVLTTDTDIEYDIEEGAKLDCEKGTRNICSAKFAHKSDLMKHIMNYDHLAAGPENEMYNKIKMGCDQYACAICNEAFSLKEDLRKHVAVHIHIPGMGPEAPCNVGDSGRAPSVAPGGPQAAGARGGARRVTLRDCSVRLERLLHHEAMPPHTEHPETGQGDVLNTHTDRDSAFEIKTYNNTKLDNDQYTCDICNEAFSVNEDLIKHVAVHIHIPSTEPHASSDVGDSNQSCFPALERVPSPRETTSVPSGAGHETRTQAIDTSTLQGSAETSVYICDMCGHLYKRKHKLIHHIKQHLRLDESLPNKPENGMNTCNICKAKFKDSYMLKRHSRVHTVKPYCCETCNKKFARLTTLKIHSRIHSGNNLHCCEICKKEFISSIALKNHFRSHTGERLYSCEICDEKFRYSSSLKTHFRRMHTGERPHSCEICKKIFLFLHSLQAHMQSHTGERLYSCEICDKKFTQSRNLKGHFRLMHTEERPYSCEICKKGFYDSYNLQEHIRSHTGERAYSCEICDKKFTYSRSFKAHFRRNHTGERLHSCGICKKGFLHPHSLQEHIRSHTGEQPYSCEICDKKFRFSSNFKRHFRRAHTGERPHSCEICKQRFLFLNSLQAHMQSHIGERSYSCEICDKKFTQSRNLKGHFRRMHTEERPYSCEICKKGFYDSYNLQEHIRSHTGERPYSCEICDKKFTYSRSFKAHFRRKHTGERLHSCGICKKEFKDASGLNVHKRTHT